MSVVKMTWQERVKQVEMIHISHLREDEKWTLEDTAKELGRSVGRTSEDLQLAKALRSKRTDGMLTYPRLQNFKTAAQALDYLKERRREEKLQLDGR